MTRRMNILHAALCGIALVIAHGVRADEDRGALKQLENLEQVTGVGQFLMVPVRDGTKLFTAVWKPSQPTVRLPTVLVRTPYTPAVEMQIMHGLLTHFAQHGYAIVIQNERGSFLSQGHFRIMGGAREDGYDTVDWVSKQPWSNGRVGTIGCSSSGDNQVPLAVTHHPAHTAMITMSSGSSIGRMGPFQEQGLVFRGGALQIGPWVPWYRSAAYGPTFQLKLPPDADDETVAYYGRHLRFKQDFEPALDYMAMQQTLPIQDAVRSAGGGPTDYDYLWRMLPNDPRFAKEPLVNEGENIGVPGLWVMQAYDVGVHPMLATFENAALRASDPGVRANQYSIISPLAHCTLMQETEHTVVGTREIGDARFPYAEVFTAWFDQWVKNGADPGSQVFARPRSQVYVPGRDRWQSFAQWPPKSRSATFFLTSGGRANSRTGDGRLQPAPERRETVDRFVYDPLSPVPSIGGDSCCSPLPTGAVDQSELEARNDILVYTSEPLKHGMDVIGWVELDLYVSADVPDTDLTAKLIDIYPDGRAFGISDSIQRVRWRDGYDEAVFMKPGEVYSVRIGPFFTSNHFAPGHRIRIDITSSNFPRYDRNLNTGGNNFDESKPRVANNAIHHSALHPSRVVMPAVDLH